MTPVPPYSHKELIGEQAIVDNSGTCTFVFPNSAAGTFNTGALCVYDSPSVAVWHVMINGINTDVIAGQCTTSGIQIGPNENLTITATNLQQFVGTTLHCTYTCIASPETNTTLLVPGHDTFFLPGSGPSITIEPIPAIGHDVNFTFTTGGYLRSILAIFDSSVAAGTRLTQFSIGDTAGNFVWLMPFVATGDGVPSATQCTFEMAPGVPVYNSGATSSLFLQMFPIPYDLAVAPGWTLQTSTFGLTPTDQWQELTIVLG